MPALPEASSRVWSGATEAEARMVVEHLTSNGVPAYLQTPLGTAVPLPSADVYVQRADADEALRLIGELQSEEPELGFDDQDDAAADGDGPARGVFASRGWLGGVAVIAIAGLVLLLLTDVI